MRDEVCLSIRFLPAVAEKVASVVYDLRHDQQEQLVQLLGDVFAFVRGLGFEVTATGARTMCIRGTAAAFEAAFRTRAPIDGWASRGFTVVDQKALDEVALQLPHLIQDIALQRSSTAVAAGIGDWPPPAASAGCIALLEDVPRLLGADRVHAGHGNGKGVTVMIFDDDFTFDHSFFAQRESSCVQRLAVTTSRPAPIAPLSGHGTAMAALVLALAPRADVVGMKLRNSVLLEGLNAALDGSSPLPDIMSISLTKDMCNRPAGTCWTELPRDLEHVADEIDLAVAHDIAVIVGAGNGDYGFPAAMKQVIAVGGVEVASGDVDKRSVWDGGSAFRSAIAEGDCKNRFVPDIAGLAGKKRGAYVVLPVAPSSTFEHDFPVSASAAPGSGWALFSGTSAATAQVAGVAALLLQHKKGMVPGELKNLLCNTAREVRRGHASEMSNLPHAHGLAAVGESGGAAGYGLIDAFAAWSHAHDAAWTGQIRPRRGP